LTTGRQAAAEAGFLGEFRARLWPATAEELAEDEEWFGPRVDPGGDPIQLAQGAPAGLILAGRRVPLVYDAATGIAHVGIVERASQCGAWGTAAIERVLSERGDTAQGVALCFGRCFGGNGQTWAEFFDEGRWQVYDLATSDGPFPRAVYLRAVHAVCGTRLAIPNRAALAALWRAFADGAWESGRRRETLSPQALARYQQKG